MKTNLDSGRLVLSEKLDAYTENDAEFKQELALLIIDNLKDLQNAVKQAHSPEGVLHYQKLVHKSRSTLVILDDPEFIDMVEGLEEALKSPNDISTREKVERFMQQSKTLIKWLEDDSEIQKAS